LLSTIEPQQVYIYAQLRHIQEDSGSLNIYSETGLFDLFSYGAFQVFCDRTLLAGFGIRSRYCNQQSVDSGKNRVRPGNQGCMVGPAFFDPATGRNAQRACQHSGNTFHRIRCHGLSPF
jgi:hypothetical protein